MVDWAGGIEGEQTIGELCHREGIKQNPHYHWRKAFLEAEKARLVGDTKRQASSNDLQAMKKENDQLMQLVAELNLMNKVLKKSCLSWGARGTHDAPLTGGEDGEHPSGGAFIPAH